MFFIGLFLLNCKEKVKRAPNLLVNLLLTITVLIRLQADLGYKPRLQISHAKN